MKEKIILKSAHPEEYGDLEVECKVIPNDQIGAYLTTIPEDRKIVGYKNTPVYARVGQEGEVVKTTLKTIVGGREYILSEEENVVKNRDGKLDVIVTNIESTSNEEYVVKQEKFHSTYEFMHGIGRAGTVAVFMPKADPRVLTQIDENVIIMTSWGAPAVCLAGSYIVTYNAETNDYNTLEQGAFESTYTKEESNVKKLRK